MTFRRKLLLFLLLFSLLSAVLVDVIGSAVLRASLRQLAEQRLERESSLLAAGLATKMAGGAMDGPRRADLQASIHEFGRVLGLRVTLIQSDGSVLADSEVLPSDLPGVQNHGDRPEVREALAGGIGRARRVSATVAEDLTYIARRVEPPAAPPAVLRLAVPTSSLEVGGGGLRATLALLAILSFGLLSATAYALTRRISSPVEAITRAAEEVASGRLPLSSARLEVRRGAREVEALAGSLERMRRTMLDQIRSLEAERGLIDTVLSGMREGLLAVDVERRVILANATLKRDLGAGEHLEGRPLAEVLRDPAAGDAFARALSDGTETRVSLTVRYPVERAFELLVAPLDSPGGGRAGAIGVFLDVTRLQALERMRREFIADVSHELRTPLASIAAAIENLLGAAGASEADRAPFLAIVKRNVQRMSALVDDLTDLSLIETGAITLSPERIPLPEAAADVVASLSSKARARSVTVLSEIPAGLAVVADRRRLDQILVNVVDNAIKFNRPGGVVRIGVQGKGPGLVLVVEDTGPGIAPSDLERIFQRFYRQERSRNREAGGTGLGLAIVKHLMRLHGGSVRAEAREEGGTRVVLTFPAPTSGAVKDGVDAA